MLLAAALCGCAARPRVDLPGAVERSAGLSNAIAFEVTGGPLNAADETPDTLTLAHSVRLAIGSDPKIQQAIAAFREAEADADQSRLLPNPIVSFVIGFRSESPFLNASLTEDVVSVLSQPTRVSAADKRLRAAASDVLATVLQTLASVQEKYAAIQAVDAQVQVLRERRQIIERLLHVARARLNAGEGRRLDVLTLDTQRVALEAEIADRELQRTSDRLALARMIGRPSGRTDWRLMPWTAPNPIVLPESDWIVTALLRRPEVQAQRWELAALGDDVALSHFAAWEGSQAGIEAERDPTWWEGPTLQSPLPVFDFGQAHVRKAKAAQIKARHQLTDIRRQVVEEVRRAYATFQQSQAALHRTEAELVPLQQRRREQAEAAYRAGEADLATLLLAETDLQDAQEKLIDLQEKSSVALIELQRAVGGPGIARQLARNSGATQPATQSPSTGSAK